MNQHTSHTSSLKELANERFSHFYIVNKKGFAPGKLRTFMFRNNILANITYSQNSRNGFLWTKVVHTYSLCTKNWSQFFLWLRNAFAEKNCEITIFENFLCKPMTFANYFCETFFIRKMIMRSVLVAQKKCETSFWAQNPNAEDQSSQLFCAKGTNFRT